MDFLTLNSLIIIFTIPFRTLDTPVFEKTFITITSSNCMYVSEMIENPLLPEDCIYCSEQSLVFPKQKKEKIAHEAWEMWYNENPKF